MSRVEEHIRLCVRHEVLCVAISFPVSNFCKALWVVLPSWAIIHYAVAHSATKLTYYETPKLGCGVVHCDKIQIKFEKISKNHNKY